MSFEFATTEGDVEVWRDPVLKIWHVTERGKAELSFENLEAALLYLINNPRPKKPELRLVKSEGAD